jgi:hypothetical protein
VVKAINKRCSMDLQAAADGYCKFWVKGFESFFLIGEV